MNRANVGNITTNAMQTLSISGTTAAGIKRHELRSKEQANTALNAQQKRDELFGLQKRKLEANIGLQEERIKGQELKNQKTEMDIKNKQSLIDRRNALTARDKAENKSISDIESVLKPIVDGLDELSEQGSDIATKINNNLAYAQRRQMPFEASIDEFGGVK